jgi:hypothetical protein
MQFIGGLLNSLNGDCDKYKIVATIFLCTNLLELSQYIWYFASIQCFKFIQQRELRYLKA